MKFETTSVLLEELNPYIKNFVIDISTDDKSDFVTVDAENHVGFEVFDNEVIAFYFTDHYHFEDYSSEFEDGQANYIARAKSFLKDLLEYKIRHIEYYKGKNMSSEKYFVIYHDGRKEKCIGNTWFGLARFINPFGKKSTHVTTWQFDKSKGVFTKCD